MFRRKITPPLPVRTASTLSPFVVMPDAPTTRNTFFAGLMVDPEYAAEVAEISATIWDDVRDVAKHNR